MKKCKKTSFLKKWETACGLPSSSGKITSDWLAKLHAFPKQNHLHRRQASCNPQINYLLLSGRPNQHTFGTEIHTDHRQNCMLFHAKLPRPFLQCTNYRTEVFKVQLKLSNQVLFFIMDSWISWIFFVIFKLNSLFFQWRTFNTKFFPTLSTFIGTFKLLSTEIHDASVCLPKF